MITKRAQRKTKREKKRFKKKTILFIIALAAIVVSFFVIMNNDYLAIENVSITGQKTLIEEDINSVVDSYLAERFISLIRKDNILVLNTNQVKRRIEITFPKIEDISVRINDGDQLLITIGERSAHSLWCVDREYESVFDEECYFADKNGLLYAQAPYFSGNVYMKFFITPSKEEKNYVGSSVDVVNSFKDFFIFLETLEERYPIDIERVLFDNFGDVFIELSRVRTVTYSKTNPAILYNQSDDYEKVIRNIGIVFDFEEFEKDFTHRPSALESIDVRFDGRVFYSFTPIGGRAPIENEEIITEIEELVEE